MPFTRFLYIVTLFSLTAFTAPGPRDTAPDPVAGNEWTISYSISLKTKHTGIGDTYNGGVKTIFMRDQQVRLRLVSLMRMQSIFINKKSPADRRVTILKESGKNKYKTYLTEQDWEQYNKKYAGITCQTTADSATILNYACRRAILTLKNGDKILAWYAPSLQQPAFALAEPAFATVPGMVLQYEYKYNRRNSIIYTATSVSHNAIDPEVFAVPDKDIPVKKFVPGK